MRTLLARTLPFVALLPLGGCPVFSAATDVPEVCVTLHDRAVDGVKPGDALRRRITADPLTDLGAFFELSGEITDARVTLHARDLPDLMFLDEVNVSVRSPDPSSDLAPLWLVSCKDYACASPTSETSAAAIAPAQTMAYLGSGTVELDITMTGPLPEKSWKVDVEICMSGSASLELSL